MASLQTLPEELLLHLTKFMPGKDIINLSHTCQRFSKVLQSDFLWSGLFMRGNLIKASDISQYAATVSKDENITGSSEKINYIQHIRVKNNWTNGRFKCHVRDLKNITLGYDCNYLVEMERLGQNSWRLASYDLRSQGATLVKTRENVKLNLRVNPDTYGSQVSRSSILVANNTAVFLYIQGGGGEKPLQLLAAYDLENGLNELWTHLTEAWGPHHLLRLFGGDIYVFNLFNNTIKVHDISSYNLKASLTLIDEMRLPKGELAGDGKYLAVPGKMVEDHTPAICVWNVDNNTHKILQPIPSFCPFQRFEKVVVSQDTVYGLLNRRCLFAWNAEEVCPLFKLDLTQSYPGQTEMFEPIFTFLSVFENRLATFTENPYIQTIYELSTHPDSGKGELISKMPKLDMRRLLKSNTQICDVKMSDSFVILHVLNLELEKYELIILPIDVTEEVLEETVRNSRITVGTYQKDEETAHIFVTSTKLLYINKNQIQIYDFL